MLADETTRFPMTCHLRFWFSGVFDRAVFAQALTLSLKRHPLLTAFKAQRGLRLHWQLAEPDLRAQLSWHHGSERDIEWPHFVAPDYRTRFVVYQEDDKTLLLVKFHHAICDGIGTIQAVEDLLLVYEQLSGGVRHELVDFDPALLADRGKFHMTARDWLRTGWWQFLRIARFFKAWPVTLTMRESMAAGAGHAERLDTVAAASAAVRLVMSADETAAVLKRCKAEAITLNDFLLAALFETLAATQSGPTRGAFRIAVPTNLRLPIDERMSAANMVSMVFLDRFPAEVGNRRPLVDGIAKEMQHIKDCRLGMAMISVCNVMTAFVGVMRFFLRLPLTQTTTVLTNLGRPFSRSALMGEDGLVRSGGVTLVGFDTLPPVRNKTRVSISVNGYGGKLSITGRYDSTTVTAAEVEALLRVYIQQIGAGKS